MKGKPINAAIYKACIAYAKELVEDEEAFPTEEADAKQAQV